MQGAPRRWPAPEVPIDEGLVRRLLEEQHPDLSGLALHKPDAGWDNVMWRLGPDLAVRMPRREAAARLIAHELRWLPELAPLLPLEVPVPLRRGRPAGGYPWNWAVVPWIEGRPADRAPPTDGVRTAERLGAFLRAMHRPAPPTAPDNPFRSGPLGTRTAAFEERLERLTGLVDAAYLRRIWDDALEAPPHPGPPSWAHGDLHPANLLVRRSTVSAVIDFGDLCAGDPAVDVGAAWMSLPGEGMEWFWGSYGGRDDALERRGRGWAVLFSLMLLEIGLEGRPTYAEVGRASLERLTAPA